MISLWYAKDIIMIIVIGGIKGGSGKTTLCTNLAAIRALQGKRVLLVDADEQCSASDWAEHREMLGITTPWSTIQLSGSAVRSQIAKMADAYDDIFIDTGGRDTTSQRSALAIANVFLTPFQPRSLDVWTVGKVVAMLLEIHAINPKLKAYAVINRADAQGMDNWDAAEIIQEGNGLVYLPVIIGQRKAFANAAAEGLCVLELKNQDKKATKEIQLLCAALFDTVEIS
jgi:chromosome partitioning protein